MLDIPELMWNIFSLLDTPSLASCSRACRTWHATANPLLWTRANNLHLLFRTFLSTKALRVMNGHGNKFEVLVRDPRAPVIAPVLANQVAPEVRQPPETPEQAIQRFNSLDIDWTRELSRLLELTTHVSSLHIDHSSLPVLELLHILRQCKPQVISSAFPRLKSLVFQADFSSYFLTQRFASRPMLEHITFHVNSSDDAMESWKKRATICRLGPAGLRSLTILPKVWNANQPGAFVASVIAARNWETIHLSCQLLDGHVWKALSDLSGLTRVTLEGRYLSRTNLKVENTRPWRMLRLKTLVLLLAAASPTLVEMFAIACPNLEKVHVRISTDPTSIEELPTTLFTPLLRLRFLSHLSIQPTGYCKTLLGDDFFQKAARSWLCLQTLDLAPRRLATRVTLQGLSSVSRNHLPLCTTPYAPDTPCPWCPPGKRCPEVPTPLPLYELRVLLDPSRIHAVFTPSLYSAHIGLTLGDDQTVLRMSPLRVLEVGCPSVYDGKEAAAFLRALFPALRSIEFGKREEQVSPTDLRGEVTGMEIGEGNLFAWTKVVQFALNDLSPRIGELRQIGMEIKTEEQEVEALLYQIQVEEESMDWMDGDLQDSDGLSFEQDSEADFDMDN
ncbi:hypothetical protein BDV93DRAFT_521712 [Ceratobasidium sp. AG-I]|nr:hypothetical protein BDV93DRAFT_521712 [Ceratobasidium sp. AG-I]